MVPFGGDQEFPLRGGGLEYFIDRPAAVIVYGRRLHTISLIIVRAEGLPVPAGPGLRPGRVRRGLGRRSGDSASSSGETGDLGYLLVSDVSGDELLTLASRLVPRTADSPPPLPGPQ